MAMPILNWKEIALLVDSIRPAIEGLFVDRVVVPARPRFTAGYLKGEWAIRLTGKRNEGTLIFSIRARNPYFTWLPGKGPRAANEATRSPFDLALSKSIKDRRLIAVEPLPRERTLIFWFSGDAVPGRNETERLGLVLSLIPAASEALLVRAVGTPPPWTILARSRTLQPGDKGFASEYVPPDGAQAPPSPIVREALVASAEAYRRAVETALEAEAFELRANAVARSVRESLKSARDRLRQSEIAAEEAAREPDWQRYGDLLKASLHHAPEIVAGVGGKPHRRVQDYRDESWIEIPADPKLGLSEQVEKFYAMARRKNRRIEEARSRVALFRGAIARMEGTLAELPKPGDWPTLEKLERQNNLSPNLAGRGGSGEGKSAKTGTKKAGAWLGKSFTSRDGLTIWAGRDKTENLELTFKHARGNDIWMHVRGRPGAHVVIPLQPGKSAPLETLLDGAQLAVYYSGGEKWGKTEVDYTFKKHVKRIKDSTEASYVQNKTLIIEPDMVRIKRLLDGAASGA